jgi:hypothetical protein
MELLEDCYKEILINERLRNVDIDPNFIEKELVKQYMEYRRRHKRNTGGKIPIEVSGRFQPQEGEANTIKAVLSVLPHYDKKYTEDILRLKDNLPKLRDSLAQTAVIFKNALYSNFKTTKNFLQKQAANIALINILNKQLFPKESNVRIPIRYNEMGNPIYPYHLLHIFLIMNVLDELYKNKQIDEKVKTFVETIIFDEEAKSQIGKEIDRYYKQQTIPLTNEEDIIEPIESTDTFDNEDDEDEEVEDLSDYQKILRKYAKK